MSLLPQKLMVNNFQWSGKQQLLCFLQLKSSGVSWDSYFLTTCTPRASSLTFIPISLSFPLLDILFFEIPSDFYNVEGIITKLCKLVSGNNSEKNLVYLSYFSFPNKTCKKKKWVNSVRLTFRYWNINCFSHNTL